MTTCPQCNGTMATRTSRRIGSLIERRRVCKACGHSDKVLVQPEQLLVVYTTNDQSPTTESKVS